MVLLSYNLVITFVLGHSDGDLDWCERALDEQLTLAPNGFWFLFLKAKLEFARGHLAECTDWYTKSWKSQDLWPQFHNLCFWELMWVHCVQQRWSEALGFAEVLAKESNWSPTIYLYHRAVILMMMNRSGTSSSGTADEDRQIIQQLMMEAPTHKQRVAGKSLPIEKFVIKKTARYFAQKKSLLLPVFELMFIWNLFKIAAKCPVELLNMYTTIDDEEKIYANQS